VVVDLPEAAAVAAVAAVGKIKNVAGTVFVTQIRSFCPVL
jgi:hypothetical protein